MSTHDIIRSYLANLEARDWTVWAASLHPDVVYVLPQTRERIRGRDGFVRFNQEFPGDWHLRARRVIAEGDQGVCWFRWRVGEDSGDAMAFFIVTDDLVTEVVDFWPDAYDPPPGREHLVERW